MTRRLDKAQTVDTIAELRAEGLPVREIVGRLGIGKSQVWRYIKTFGIYKDDPPPKCPHCGVAIKLTAR